MNDRDAAIEAIKSGQSVVVNRVQYTMKNMADLPGLEAFVGDDPKSKEDAMKQLRQEKEDLEKRLSAMESSPKASAKKDDAKSEDTK